MIAFMMRLHSFLKLVDSLNHTISIQLQKINEDSQKPIESDANKDWFHIRFSILQENLAKAHEVSRQERPCDFLARQ